MMTITGRLLPIPRNSHLLRAAHTMSRLRVTTRDSNFCIHVIQLKIGENRNAHQFLIKDAIPITFARIFLNYPSIYLTLSLPTSQYAWTWMILSMLKFSRYVDEILYTNLELIIACDVLSFWLCLFDKRLIKMIKFVEFSNRIELEKLKSLDNLCVYVCVKDLIGIKYGIIYIACTHTIE